MLFFVIVLCDKNINRSPGARLAKNNYNNKNQIFEKKIFNFILHGEKENFEEYSLNLAFAKLSFLL
jgi:hypothetical protein